MRALPRSSDTHLSWFTATRRATGSRCHFATTALHSASSHAPVPRGSCFASSSDLVGRSPWTSKMSSTSYPRALYSSASSDTSASHAGDGRSSVPHLTGTARPGPFVRHEGLTGRTIHVRYDNEDAGRLVEETIVQPKTAEQSPQDGLMGAGFVEARLTGSRQPRTWTSGCAAIRAARGLATVRPCVGRKRDGVAAFSQGWRRMRRRGSGQNHRNLTWWRTSWPTSGSTRCAPRLGANARDRSPGSHRTAACCLIGPSRGRGVLRAR